MKKLLVIILVIGMVAVLFTRGNAKASPGEYVVQPGDTLAEIAVRYGVTVDDLVALNRDRYPGLAVRPDLIEVGWHLRVPGRGDVAAQAREKAEQVLAYVDALAMTAVADEPTPTPTPLPFSDPAQVDAWRKEVRVYFNLVGA